MFPELHSYEQFNYDTSYFKSFSPERCRAVALLAEMGLVMHKIRHSLVVADTALLIAENVEKAGIPVDKKTVEIGALLHDVGLYNMHFEPGKNDFVPEHYFIGAEIVLSAGYSEEVALCVERHDCAGFVKEVIRDLGLPTLKNTPDTLPQTIEQKIVAYADTVISVEGEAACDVWNDPHAAAKGLFNYLNVVYVNRLGKTVSKTHPQFEYVDKFNAEMKQYLSRDQYEKLIRPQVLRMNAAQSAAGIILPFPTIEW